MAAHSRDCKDRGQKQGRSRLCWPPLWLPTSRGSENCTPRRVAFSPATAGALSQPAGLSTYFLGIATLHLAVKHLLPEPDLQVCCKNIPFSLDNFVLRMHLGGELGPSALVGGSPAPHVLRARTQSASSYLPLATIDNQYHNDSDCYGSQGHQHAGPPVASEGTQLDCGVNVCPERHVENL